MIWRSTVRRIDKGNEPACLAEVRREARRIQNDTGKAPHGGDWDLKGCAQPVRASLCTEQLGLCAYCMGRIEPRPYSATAGGMKIEHFVARSDEPSRMYDWDNLLGACGGQFVWGGDVVETCDTARRNRPLRIHPANSAPSPEDVFTPEGDGRLSARTPEAQADLQILNLNAQHLINNRSGVIDALRQRLRQDDSPKALRRLYETATTPAAGSLPPYAPVAARYLERKMRQHRVTP
jgi:uncharacterized protein (TIGR02646 family)